MKVAAVARRAQPHQVRGEDDVGVVVQRVASGRLGVEHVQADPGQPAVRQRPPRGVGVDEPAAAAVDQDRARPDPGQERVVDQVAGLPVSGRCRVMTSLRAARSPRLAQCSTLGRSAGGSLTGS